ncbi:major facilitator superfamily domain-containing protein [Lipomyces japonicus]|uniref:major facilitator superfamily domain-containing protein n=1 Tax=Lipomyces japonicus TaxID=56871 RepID=UPI0034CD3245
MEKENAAGLDEQVEFSETKQELFAQFAGKDAEWVEFKRKRLVRKIDRKLLPCLVTMYLLNFLDRSNLAQARLGTLQQDLNMHGTDYNLATSILFVGYLLMQLPSNLLLTRVRPSVYLATAMTLWGAVSACQAALNSFAGLIVCRFLLGVVEAPFFPGAIMLMSSWYTRSELAFRIAWFYAGSALANMFGGLLGAGVLGNLHNAHGISGWRWLFIIEGSITVAVAIMSGFILPNFPTACRWLTEEEAAFAQWRLSVDVSEADDDPTAVTVKQGLKLALKDYKLYMFVLLLHMSIVSQTFQYFFPSIVNTLGFDKITSLLLTAPVWFLQFVVSLVTTYTSGKYHDRSIHYRDRSWHIILLMLVSCIGNVIVTATTTTGPRFFAMFLMPMGAVSAFTIILAWVANTFPRPMVKRSASIAICNMIGNTASNYGSYMYPSSQSPRYLTGGTVNAIICLLVASMAFIIKLVLWWKNKKLATAEAQANAPIGFRFVL